MNTQFFEKRVDRRSRQAMTQFLTGHYRYDTLGSVNLSTSYAHCVKLHSLGLTKDQTDKAFEMLATPDFIDEVSEAVVDEFTRDMNGHYTIGFNGRCDGYLVLYNSAREATDHKSICTHCGQLNYTRIAPEYAPDDPDGVIAAEILKSSNAWHAHVYLGQSAIQALDLSDDDKLARVRRLKQELKGYSRGDQCGVCGATRRNLERPIYRLKVYPMKGIDQYEDFSDWSMEDLRDRVDLVTDFDRACDAIRANLINIVDHCHVVEEIVHVPKTVRRIECAC